MLPTTKKTPCAHCAPFATKKFSSQEDFVAFEKELEAKCVDGTFIQVVNADDTEEMSLQVQYQCTHCGNDWTLSIPENAYRGYFSPNTEIEHEQTNTNFFQANMRKRGKGNCGCCLGMIFLLILLLLYGLYNLVDFLFDLIF